MRRAASRFGGKPFKRRSGLLLGAVLVTAACRGFCMLGGGPSSRIKGSFVRETRGRVAQQVFDSAWHWMTDGGKIDKEEMQKLKNEVEQRGGRIVSNSGDTTLIRNVSTVRGWWLVRADGVNMQLRLHRIDKSSEADILKAEHHAQSGRVHFQHKHDSEGCTTTYTAWHAVRDEACKRIQLVYGTYQLSVETLETPVVFPENCIKLGDRTFTVLPPASPHKKRAGRDMEDRWFKIPAGWRICDGSADDWDAVINSIIKPYKWATDLILAQSGQSGQSFLGWHPFSGKQNNKYAKLDYDADQHRYRFPGYSSRVLIEKMPGTSIDLGEVWERYVQLRAEDAWSKRLASAAAEES